MQNMFKDLSAHCKSFCVKKRTVHRTKVKVPSKSSKSTISAPLVKAPISVLLVKAPISVPLVIASISQLPISSPLVIAPISVPQVIAPISVPQVIAPISYTLPSLEISVTLTIDSSDISTPPTDDASLHTTQAILTWPHVWNHLPLLLIAHQPLMQKAKLTKQFQSW
jgi:hypothetical protein